MDDVDAVFVDECVALERIMNLEKLSMVNTSLRGAYLILQARWENVADLLELGNNLLVCLVLLEERIDKLGNVETECALEGAILGAHVLLHTVDLVVVESGEDHVFVIVNALLYAGPLDLFGFADLDVSANEVGIGVLGDEVKQL